MWTLILNYIDSLFPLTYCAYNQIKHVVPAAALAQVERIVSLSSLLTAKLRTAKFSRTIVFESWETDWQSLSMLQWLLLWLPCLWRVVTGGL